MNFLEIIATDLDLDTDYVKSVIAKSQSSYRIFCVPKRTGGTRTIYQPSAELKTLQYWLVYNVFSKFPVSASACAYCHGRSILDAARKHLTNNYILHMDIKNFFESITARQLHNLLENAPATTDIHTFDLKSADAIKYIQHICLYKNHLTIGAVSSPILSNIIFYEIDLQIEKYCADNNYIYTRYADDIYISSKHFLSKDICKYIATILDHSGFKVNTKKTRFMSRNHRQIITGLTLTTDRRLSIGKRRKRALKKELYIALKALPTIDEKERLRIKGYLSFLKSVDYVYCNNLINKYAKVGDIKQLL